jgi:hypothetical protein
MWWTWLIAIGAITALGAIVWVVFKFAKGNIASSVIDLAGGIAKTVAGYLPNDADKTDAADIILVVGRLAQEIPAWASDPTNESWVDCKEEILAFIEEQRKTMPAIDKLPAGSLESAAEALFGVAKMTNLGK